MTPAEAVVFLEDVDLSTDHNQPARVNKGLTRGEARDILLAGARALAERGAGKESARWRLTESNILKEFGPRGLRGGGSESKD